MTFTAAQIAAHWLANRDSMTGFARQSKQTYVNRSLMTLDYDYVMFYLLEVVDQTDDETWVSYLMVHQKHSDICHCEWPSGVPSFTFFDTDTRREAEEEAMHRLIGWSTQVTEFESV